MIPSEEIALAATDVESAFLVLEHALRVLSYHELALFDYEAFGQELTLLLKEENISFSDRYFVEPSHCILTAKMSVGAAFGASAIALDNLFETYQEILEDKSIDRLYPLWSIVYAVRNAFAHGIANPKWEINKKYQRRIHVELDGKPLSIDLTALNEQQFTYSQIGGFATWHKIKDAAIMLTTASKPFG
jgi:hypothetical protein